MAGENYTFQSSISWTFLPKVHYNRFFHKKWSFHHVEVCILCRGCTDLLMGMRQCLGCLQGLLPGADSRARKVGFALRTLASAQVLYWEGQRKQKQTWLSVHPCRFQLLLVSSSLFLLSHLTSIFPSQLLPTPTPYFQAPASDTKTRAFQGLFNKVPQCIRSNPCNKSVSTWLLMVVFLWLNSDIYILNTQFKNLWFQEYNQD